MIAGAGQNVISGGSTFGAQGFRGTAKTIGSIKNRQINYSPEHTFFNTQTHMRPQAIAVKKVVQNEIDRDLLGTKASKWNDSVALPTSNRPEDMGGNFNKDLQQSH